MVPVGTTKAKVKDFIKVKVNILWKGSALSCVKTFGTRSCKLCSKEKLLAILALCRNTLSKSFNKNNEVYGACHHIPRFHRFTSSVQIDAVSASADESVVKKDERNMEKPNSTSRSVVASAASIKRTPPFPIARTDPERQERSRSSHSAHPEDGYSQSVRRARQHPRRTTSQAEHDEPAPRTRQTSATLRKRRNRAL